MKILNRCSNYDRAAKMRIKAGLMVTPASLDFLLDYSRKHPIPAYDKFRNRLLALLKHKNRLPADAAKIAKIVNSLPHLKKDVELGEAAVSKVAEILGFRSIPDLNKEITMKCEDYYKSRMLQCLMLKALTSVMPRAKAIEYFGGFADKRSSTYKFAKYSKVMQHLNLHEQIKKGPLKNGAVFVQAVTDDGRAVMKITRCRPAQVLLSAVKDAGIVHAVICQPDIAAAKLNNPHFVLTREKSLVLGMPYCGHVWHDKREHKNIVHPPRKFWQEIR